MVSVLTDSILEFHPDTLEYVRKDVNLEKEGRIEEAVNILDDWVKKQQHFIKKDFSRDYLERTLINAKGMVERAKQRIDKLCTFKTLMPELFPGPVSQTQFETLDKYVRYALLPKMTKEHYRMSLFNVKSDDYQSSDIHNFYRYVTVISEYIRIHDYNSGLVIALDFRDASILTFITKCTPMELRQIITLMTEGYGMRIKQIHLITPSKMLDALVGFLKQVLSSKLAGRIHLHKTMDTFYDFVPKDILPEEYGGKERSLQTLSGKEYLEKCLITCKGSVEKTKKQIDRCCTMRTLLPKFFSKTSSKELPFVVDLIRQIPLPEITEDLYRVVLFKVTSQNFTAETFMQYYQYVIINSEYVKAHDYVNGFIIIHDYNKLNILDLLSKMNHVELQQFVSIILECYGTRMKRIIILSESKAIQLLIKTVKQLVSEKIGKRIQVVQSLEDLHKVVPKNILPVEYGGNERSIEILHEEWVEELSSDKHVEYMKMMNKACTDETKRLEGKFNEEYMGMPGAFRNLSVD